MAHYVDGYVIPIKKSKLKLYKKFAVLGCKTWMKHGALDYYECVGDDLIAKWGMGFKKMCKLKAGETVVFAFVVYKSKADRNRIIKAVMADPAMQPPPSDPKKKQKMPEMPFDMQRFATGGFKTLVAAK